MSTEPDVTEIRHLDSAVSALRAPFQLALDSAARRVLAERMSEELLDLNRKMRGAQSMLVRDKSVSMVASMAAGAAHELNNPLSVISGRAQMQLSQCDDPDQQRVWKMIVDQANNAAGIVKELMAFAKPAPPQPISFSLAELLESLCQHWHAGLSLESGAITFDLGDSELMVYADLSQTSEILEAFVTNAVEASRCPQEGAMQGPVKVQINSPSCSSDENVRIVVTDDGVGMTHEVLEHAIDPFFSSRGAGRGRGLGLSRAYRLTELNGGRLWFESQPGQGTVVTVELPARAPTSET